jgi:hypothetical protein
VFNQRGEKLDEMRIRKVSEQLAEQERLLERERKRKEELN